MSNDIPRFIESPDIEAFPTFITYGEVPTAEQLEVASRHRIADIEFGLHKQRLSSADVEKIARYLRGDSSLNAVIEQLKSC